MSTSVATRLGMFAAVLGLGLTVAAVPAAAAPQQSGAQLSIYRDPANPNFTQFTIEGTYAMQQPDAQGYLNNIYTGAEIGGMEYLIYGDRRRRPGSGAAARVCPRHRPHPRLHHRRQVERSASQADRHHRQRVPQRAPAISTRSPRNLQALAPGAHRSLIPIGASHQNTRKVRQ